MLDKKIAAIMLTAVMAITFSACSNSSKAPKTAGKATTILYEEYRFPAVGLATLLPVPKSNIGEIIENKSTVFYLDVDKTSTEEFNSYLKKCAETGFIFDHSEYQESCYVFYKESYELTVFYNERDSLMSIIINEMA